MTAPRSAKAYLRHWPLVVLPALVATLSVLFWPPERAPLLQTFHRLEWTGYDLLFALRGPRPEAVDDRIVVLGYDRDTEQALKQPWPPPRRFHARVIDALVKDGAKVIVFDVLFSTPSNAEDDRLLDKSLSRAPQVVLACRINRDDVFNRKSMEGPYYSDALGIDFERKATTGFVEVYPDTVDEVVRRMIPVLRFQGEWLPSLPGAAYLALTGKTAQDVRIEARHVRVGSALVPRTGPSAPDPVEPGNFIHSSYLQFPGGLNIIPIHRYEQAYLNEFAPGTFKGKVVFIGVTGPELTKSQSDRYRTAYSRFNLEIVGGQSIGYVYGVVIQAQMLNALLRNTFLHPAPGWLTWLFTFGFTLLGAWSVRNFINWRGPLLLVLSVAFYFVLVYTAFDFWHVHLPWTVPSLLILLSVGGVAYFERGRLRKVWAGYASPGYIDVMVGAGMDATARRLEATVLFGDIRGFTSFSEKHEPETVVWLLNRHMEKLVRFILESGGAVDKYLGDGILANFGVVPSPSRQREDHAVRAVRCAWQMRAASLLPVTDAAGKEHSLATGFGITTGPLILANVGSRQRRELTIIGDTVNLASRLQGVTGQPDVIIDEATYERVKPYVTVEPQGKVDLKGKAEPVACFKVLEWREAGAVAPASEPQIAVAPLPPKSGGF